MPERHKKIEQVEELGALKDGTVIRDAEGEELTAGDVPPSQPTKWGRGDAPVGLKNYQVPLPAEAVEEVE